jgi:YbbR domain-containing protein
VVVTLTVPAVTKSVPVPVETTPEVMEAVPGTSADPYTEELVVMLPPKVALETV